MCVIHHTCLPPPQTDIHIPQMTVEESVAFSAALRLPTTVDAATRASFVEEVGGWWMSSWEGGEGGQHSDSTSRLHSACCCSRCPLPRLASAV